MEKKQSEALRASEGLGVALGAARHMAEDAHASGVYTAALMGPREQDRARYCALRDRIATIESSNFIAQLLSAKLLDDLKREFQGIELERKWEDTFCNVVTTVGGNLALDTLLAGSAYTVTGPYMGLINGSASSAAIGDTMASHAAWLEVGSTNAPAYSGSRKTVSFSSAASKSKASTGTYTYSFTSGGTVGGAFLVLGASASATVDNTSGTLYSAGAFTGGSKTVANGDTLTVTYTASV